MTWAPTVTKIPGFSIGPQVSPADRLAILAAVNGVRQKLQSGRLLGGPNSLPNPTASNLVQLQLDPCYDEVIRVMSSTEFVPSGCVGGTTSEYEGCDIAHAFAKCTPKGANWVYATIAQDTINALSSDVKDGVIWRINREVNGKCFYSPDCERCIDCQNMYIGCIPSADHTCIWAYNYIAQFLSAEWLTFDCVRLDTKKEKHAYRYICFGRALKTFTSGPNKNQPYLPGKPCDQCPGGYTGCSNGLCASV